MATNRYYKIDSNYLANEGVSRTATVGGHIIRYDAPEQLVNAEYPITLIVTNENRETRIQTDSPSAAKDQTAFLFLLLFMLKPSYALAFFVLQFMANDWQTQKSSLSPKPARRNKPAPRQAARVTGLLNAPIRAARASLKLVHAVADIAILPQPTMSRALKQPIMESAIERLPAIAVASRPLKSRLEEMSREYHPSMAA